jgi:HTH-type transcriptional regulator / antitoxin HigA
MTVTDAAYRELLSDELPHAIHTDREHRRYLERVERLLSLKKRSAAQDRFLELLSVLIERYEEEHDRVESPEPLAALKELMAANGISQAAFGRLLGSSGIASEILAGKRALSKAHIRKLAELFNVSTDVFV